MFFFWMSNRTMIKRRYIFPVCLLILIMGSCKLPNVRWQYQVECNGLGAEGVQSLKVKTRANKKSKLWASAQKDAIHSALFRGAPIGERGCPKMAMINISGQNESIHKNFFGTFFSDGGDYKTFIASQPVLISPVINISKGVYEAEYIVGVRYNALKEYLKQNKIIYSIQDGF